MQSPSSSMLCLPGSLLLSDASDDNEEVCSAEMILCMALGCAVLVVGSMFVYWQYWGV